MSAQQGLLADKIAAHQLRVRELQLTAGPRHRTLRHEIEDIKEVTGDEMRLWEAELRDNEQAHRQELMQLDQSVGYWLNL